MITTKKRVVALIISIIMVFCALPVTAFASIPNWEKENVVFDGTSFGTNGYYNVISKKDYVLVPGAAVESEIVLNNADGTRRQVLHVIEVDPSNPDVSIVPGYYQIDKNLDDEANWSHKELTEMAKYYEDNLGYNIVGGMNTDLYYESYSPRVLVYNRESIGNFGENVATGGAVLNPTSSILYVFQAEDGTISCDVKAFNKTEFNNYLESGTLLHAVGVSFGMTVKDGELVKKTEERTSAAAARSMVGVKEDGTLVICMNDGRGANNSVGFCDYELGESMLALGCQWAANCDGGGSSTFISKRVGEDEITMRSVPCDGAQRPTAHGIFVASNVAPTGELDVVNIESDYDIYAPKTAYTFGAKAIDTHGYEMDMPEDITWALSDASFGTVVNGTFTSNGKKGSVDIQVISGGRVVGSKTISVADPAVFNLSATSTTMPYSTEDKVRTITLPIVAMTGEANVYIDTNAVFVALSNNAAGILDGFKFTSTSDTAVAGVDVTITYSETVLTYKIEFGKGSEILFDFEDGDKAGFMGFEEAKKWSQDNGVNNTLVGSDPLAGQFNEYLSSETFISSTENGGAVRNGNYALAWRLDNTDASFASWSYNVLFNVGETIVLRDVANGLKATTLGMWLYIPENAFPAAGKGLAFQSQLYTKNADGSYSCKQDHFMFTSAATGKQTNLNSATNADIPESRWVYVSINISAYDYLCMPVSTDEGNTRSPSFIRTYVKPDTADVVTFYIDDITLDYSSAVDDRVLPTITDPKYGIEVDDARALNNGDVLTNAVANPGYRFFATAEDNAALDITTGKIFIDGVEVPTAAGNTRGISTEQRYILAPGTHTVSFEIKDELGNPARLTRTFVIEGDPNVELGGHNDSETTPKAQSVYYVDINVADLANVNKLVAVLKLNNSNTWETEGAIVANGFKVAFDYNEISELLTVTVEKDGVSGKALDNTLVSIPVRVWTYDRYDYVKNEYMSVANMGNKPVVNINCEVVYGVINDNDSFAGSINVATELTTISSPYHEHDAELAILSKEATTTEYGYENRTYCETCKSVVDWGTIIPKVEITHNYEIVDGKFVCSDESCGEVYASGTGIFEMNGALYYSIAGNLLKGWQTVDTGAYCYAYSNYQLAVGEVTINGIVYDFGSNGITEGAWVKDANGTKFSYGLGFYNCSAAASPHANVAWVVISGKTYAFDKNGYRHENVSMLVESNAAGKMYEFTSEGVLLGEYVTDHTGIFVCNNVTTYLENGTPTTAGLVFEGGYYYYINSGYRAVTGSYNVTRTNDLLPVGTYEFGADGRMLNPPVVKHGPQADGTFYLNGIKQQAYQLIEYEGDYYFVDYYNGDHRYLVERKVYLGDQFLVGTPFVRGTFEFDENGKMVVLDGPQADGTFYLNGVKQQAYQLIEYKGDYYFVDYYNGDHRYLCDRKVYLADQFLEGTTFIKGMFEFDENGKMVILDGPQADGTFYLNGIKQQAYQLIEYKGDYYFVDYYNGDHRYLVERKVYLGDQFLVGTTFVKGYYEFDENGKMIILDGPQADGTFYINGVKQQAYQLVEYKGDYYFVDYYNGDHRCLINCKVYLGDQFLVGTPFVRGTFEFDETGKMVVLDGPQTDGTFYINGVKQQAYQLIEYKGDYYFVDYYNGDHRYLCDRKVYLADQFLEGTGFVKGYYEFDENGKMIILDGPQADGTFYLKGVKQQAYQLIEYKGDYYFIDYYNGDHRYLVNKQVYLRENFLVGTPFTEWYYTFDAEGKMVGHLAGVSNLRDLGTVPYMKTGDGKTIKEGLLLRGPGLDGLEGSLSATAAKPGIDLLLNEYGIKFDMDLRSTNYANMDVEDIFGDDVVHEYYGMVYYADVLSDKGKDAVKNIFVDLANPDNYPIYMHCARGVDRTGIITYILGAMLGVSEGNLANEYMLSVTAYGNDILKVRDALKTYGGSNIQECAEAYLLDCGVTMEQIESIRNILLED